MRSAADQLAGCPCAALVVLDCSTLLDLALTLPLDAEGAEVRRAKERDASVWSAWYDRYFPVLFRYVLARTGRREDAEDRASQVFVRALESIDRYHYKGRPVLAWLYRIAHNLVADRQRRGKGRSFVPLDSLSISVLPEDEVESRMELARALNSLNRAQREIIVLRYQVAMNTQEIGSAWQE
jgi:RNA polymerase sigma-70 factor (ECF subfamily)